MRHSILVMVNGSAIEADAETATTPAGRKIEQLSYAGSMKPQTVREINAQGLSLSDILEVVRHYLNAEEITGELRSFGCGELHVEYAIVDPGYLKADLTGKRYHVRVVGQTGLVYENETGACNSWEALDIMRAAVREPIRSSIVYPLEA